MTVDNGSDRQVLEAFLIDNPDFERLEILLAEFNFFEAVGVTRQELRHSDFLAFLLDPRQPHGLGDSFLSIFLRKVVQSSDLTGMPFSAIDVTLWDLADTEVRREWRRIDLLILNESLQLAIIIENKIGSSEHSDQLRRYLDVVSKIFHGWRVAGVYLTPDGDAPSEDAFVPCSYNLVYDAIETLLDSRTTVMGEDVRSAVRHYAQLLQRHVMNDSEIAELCERIYRRHLRALDLIYEHRPDRAAIVTEMLLDMVKAEAAIELDRCTKNYVRFLPKSWDLAPLQVGKGWTPTGRMLLFEFRSDKRGIILQLYVGPGPDEIRQAVLDTAVKSPSFNPSSKSVNTKWNGLFEARIVVSASDLEELEEEALDARVSEFWRTFFANTWGPMVDELDPVLKELAHDWADRDAE